MIVEIPPKLEAYAIASMIPSAKFATLPDLLFSFTTKITEAAMGYIIIVVAVLLSHILNNPVARINPSIILLPLVPVMFTIVSAIRLCRFHFSIASPIINPPINKKMTESAYFAVVSLIPAIPINGKSTMGMSATAGIGIASPIHHVIINAATAKTFLPFASRENGLTRRKNMKSKMPRNNPIRSRNTGDENFKLFNLNVLVTGCRLNVSRPFH